MYISCIVGFAIIFLYCLIATILNKEMPNSISQIVYGLSDKWKWTFMAVMFIVSFMIAPQLFTIAGEKYAFLAFFTILGILGVGADPLVKGNKNTMHYASAILMGISSQTLVYLLNPSLLMTWIPYILYTLYNEDGTKNMFVGEMSMLSNKALLCLL